MSRENEVGRIILDAAFTIHSELGTGLLESAYETALEDELRLRGLRVRRQARIAVRRKSGRALGTGFRADLIVEDIVLVELKAVSSLQEVHFRQALTYLRLSGLRLAYLLNFDVVQLSDGGIRRLVNGLPDGA